MSFLNEKWEILIPLFFGAFGSLVLCTALTGNTSLFFKTKTEAAKTEIYEEKKEMMSPSFLAVTEKETDAVMEYYRNPEYRDWVIDFFAGVCSDREIAQAILENADEFDVPVCIAFALSWEESRFNPRAINRHNRDGSIDRGLFQLNNRSFPELNTLDFFSIKSNTRYGVSHLRHCIDSGGSIISALAMYNAGAGRVRTSGAPKITLDYISRILENKNKIESRFHTMLIKEEENRLVEKTDEPSQQPYFSRTLISASPL